MNLLITGAWREAKEHISFFQTEGHRVKYMQYEQDELPCAPEWVEGIIGNGIFLFHSIEEFVNLHYIQLTSAGYDRVPMDYIKEHKIQIYNARGVYSVPMAEFAVAGVLALYKRLPGFLESQRNHEWQKRRDLLELSGKKVLVVGFGSVGQECAKRFRAFGTMVLAADIQKPEMGFDVFYSMEHLPEALARADIVILTLPLTEETRGMFDEKAFTSCKPGVILVNISRGAIVKERALVEALRKGTLGGAVLDVFETEPLPESSPLWDMPNVIVTPHNSFISSLNSTRLLKLIMENLPNRKSDVL